MSKQVELEGLSGKKYIIEYTRRDLIRGEKDFGVSLFANAHVGDTATSFIEYTNALLYAGLVHNQTSIKPVDMDNIVTDISGVYDNDSVVTACVTLLKDAVNPTGAGLKKLKL